MNRYSRQDVLRILRISSRQLHGWEKAGLIVAAADYGFQDLVQLRKLRDLRAMRISASSIRASVHAMRAVSGMANPLLEAGVPVPDVARAAGNTVTVMLKHYGKWTQPQQNRLDDYVAATWTKKKKARN